MITVQEQIKQVILKRVRELNGSNTEEGLNMLITEKLIADKFSIEEFKKNIKIITGEPDEGKIVPNGAWVYRDASDKDWIFEKFDTIADAIRTAVKNINAIVLCNGEEISFDTINNDIAYYIEKDTEKIRVVRLDV